MFKEYFKKKIVEREENRELKLKLIANIVAEIFSECDAGCQGLKDEHKMGYKFGVMEKGYIEIRKILK